MTRRGERERESKNGIEMGDMEKGDRDGGER